MEVQLKDMLKGITYFAVVGQVPKQARVRKFFTTEAECVKFIDKMVEKLDVAYNATTDKTLGNINTTRPFFAKYRAIVEK